MPDGFDAGSSWIQLGVSLDDLAKGFAQGQRATDDFARNVEQRVESTGGSFGKLGSIASGIFGGIGFKVAEVGFDLVGNAASKAFGLVSGGIDDARNSGLLLAQTENVIRSTGAAAGVTAQHVVDLATALSDASGASLFGDDQIQESENLLLTFTNIKGATLDAATAISVDLAQAMGGAPKDSAIQLGKALNDPIKGVSALSRVGVTFTDQQKEQIRVMQESGDMAGAQAVILAELNKEFGGSAAAAAAAADPMVRFHAVLGETAEGIGASLLPAIDSLTGVLTNPAVMAGITSLGEGLASGIGTAATWLTDTAIPGLITEWQSLSSAFQTGGLAGVGTLIMGQLGELGSSVLGWIGQQAPIWGAQLLTWGQAFIGWIAPYVPIVLTELGQLALSVGSWIVAQAPGWAAQLATWGQAFIAWIAPMIPPLLAKAGELGQQFIAWIGEQAAPILAKITAWGESLVAWIVPATKDFLAKWPVMFDQFLSWIGEQAGPLLAKFGDWATSFIAWVIPMIPPFLEAVGGIAVALLIWVGETAGVLLNKIVTEWVPAFINWIATDAIPKIGPALGGLLDTIGGWITTAAGSLLTMAASMGSSIVSGIQNGISNAWGRFTGWLNDQINKIPAVIRNALGIGSPSKVMADEVGRWIPLGIADGIDRSGGAVTDAMQALVGDATDETAPVQVTTLVEGLTGDAFVGTWQETMQRVQPALVAQMTDTLQVLSHESIIPWAEGLNERLQLSAGFWMQSLADGISGNRTAIDAMTGMGHDMAAALTAAWGPPVLAPPIVSGSPIPDSVAAGSDQNQSSMGNRTPIIIQQTFGSGTPLEIRQQARQGAHDGINAHMRAQGERI